MFSPLTMPKQRTDHAATVKPLSLNESAPAAKSKTAESPASDKAPVASNA